LGDHGVRRLMLTASGGPFRTRKRAELAEVTPDEACAHPNWVMGRKISVDSATMMNKGLEVIEARWLFNIPVEKIQVNIHPQSIIHSMVEYVDGCVIAQLPAHPGSLEPVEVAEEGRRRGHILHLHERGAIGNNRAGENAQQNGYPQDDPDTARIERAHHDQNGQKWQHKVDFRNTLDQFIDPTAIPSTDCSDDHGQECCAKSREQAKGQSNRRAINFEIKAFVARCAR
jgi:hypothetical protein